MSLGKKVLDGILKYAKGSQLQIELVNSVNSKRDFAEGLRGKVPFDAKIEGHVFTYCPTTKTVIRKEPTK